MHRSLPLRLTLGAALLVLGIGAAQADPLVIRHGWVSITNVLSPVIFENKAALKHYGTSYTVQPIHFAGTTPELQALAAGEVDIVTFGNSTVFSAIENAHMADIRVVADALQDGVADYFSSRYLVRGDSPVKTVEDLKGKVAVTNAIGGAVDVALRAMLRQHHLDDRKDISVIEAEFSAMPSMLLEKKVDLIGEVTPFVYNPQLEKASRLLFTMRDAVGPSQEIVLAARAGWLAKNHAALVDFFEDMVRGTRWFLDPANRDAAIKITAAAAKQSPDVLGRYLYTKKDYYHDPDGRPNLTELQHDADVQHELGFVKTPLDVKQYADLSFIDEAVKRLH